MIIVINGSLGVGKTSTSWALMKLIDYCVMLDGDILGAVNPFELADSKRFDYFIDTMSHLIKFHKKNSYRHFVINYVFENATEFDKLIDKLHESDDHVRSFLLTCNREKQKARIIKRNNETVDGELKRSKELNGILEQSSELGFIGEKIDTSDVDATRTATQIFQKLAL